MTTVARLPSSMRWHHSGISILCGLMLTLAFAPFAFFALAAVSIALMLWVWSCSSPAIAARYGYLFGLAHFSSSIYWIYHSLHYFGNASIAFSVLATILLVVLLSLYLMLLGWVVASLVKRIHPLVFCLGIYPLLWVLYEWSRAVLLTGFPWNLVGQAVIDSPFAGILPLLGTLGASWLVVFIAGAVVLVVQWHNKKMCAAISLLVSAVLLLTWLSGRIEWTEPSGPEIRVGIVQAGISQDLKFDKDAFLNIVATYQQLTTEITDHDLVIWPETAIPTYYRNIATSVLMPVYESVVAAGGGDFMTGVFFSEGGQSYNSLVKVGAVPVVYHKRHLVPFGEYIPLRWLVEIFRNYVLIPMSDLSVGNRSPLLSIGKYQVGVSICYEAIFGQLLIGTSAQADYLVNVSNDSWFGDSIAKHQHLQMARLRAIESGRAMVRATSTGISALIDHRGDVVTQAVSSAPRIVGGLIQPRQGLTPYARWGSRWGNSEILVILVLLLIICFIISARFLSSREDI